MSVFFQEMDTWYKTKFHDMGHASTKHAESVRALREEIAGYRKDVRTTLSYTVVSDTTQSCLLFNVYLQILNKERDLDFQKMRNEFLETQICEAKEKNKKEEENLQVTPKEDAASFNSQIFDI